MKKKRVSIGIQDDLKQMFVSSTCSIVTCLQFCQGWPVFNIHTAVTKRSANTQHFPCVLGNLLNHRFCDLVPRKGNLG